MKKNVEVPFGSNPVPMLIYRIENLQIVDVNSAAVSMYGYIREQMLGMTIKDLFPERDVSSLIKRLREENPDSQVKDAGIFEHLTSEGHPLYVNVFPQPYQEGDETRLVILQDVSSEFKNYQQNRLLSLVARYTSNGVVITDSDKKIEWVNKAWTRITGYTLEEALGKNPGNLVQGPETDQETVDYMSQNFKKGKGFRTRILNYRKDGMSFWNDMEIQPVHDEEGQVILWVGVKNDISARMKAQQMAKESETLFYRALRLAPIPVMLREENGTISFINKAFEEAAGYKLEDIPNIDRWVRKAHPHSIEESVKIIGRVFEKGELDHTGSYPVYTKNGDTRLWEFWDSPLGYMAGRDSQTAIVMAVDVTDKVEFSRQIEQQLEDKSMLLEEIHHRVKNNLAVITALLSLQKEESDSAEVKESLQEAQNRIQSIAMVHQQLYNQAESGASIDMDDYLASLSTLLHQSSEPPGTTLEIKAEADNTYVPLVKAVPIGLIVSEFITNACKHAFEGKIEGSIHISLTQEPEYYSLKVSDNGKGLPEDFNMESGHTGMDIIKSLLTQLKAELTYDSKYDEGTSFTLQVPL